MFRYKLTIATLLLSLSMMAQTEYLPIRVYVENLTEPFPANAKVQVVNKLNQLLTQNSIASTDPNGQFILTVFAVPQDKNVLPGPPMQIVETMDMTFYIADIANQLVFSSTAQTVKGVGQGEARAYMDAIKQINLRSDNMKQFVTEGRNKIIEYYDHEADRIIQEAHALAVAYQYEAAIYKLLTIPSQCKAGERALKEAVLVFQEMRNHQCNELLGNARVAWAAEQNAIGANKAGEFLAQIYPEMDCYDEAMNLYTEIKGKVLDDWKFEMKKYQDGVDLEMQRIEATRAIGVAYGNNQQPTSTNIGFLR